MKKEHREYMMCGAAFTFVDGSQPTPGAARRAFTALKNKFAPAGRVRVR